MSETPELLRSYGSHFSVKDKQKIQMPRISWNAQVRSVKHLRDLQVIKLLNYKQVTSGSSQDTGQMIRMQLEFLQSQNPYTSGAPDIKSYLVDKEGLQVFIESI
jgi:hypothetical protein